MNIPQFIHSVEKQNFYYFYLEIALSNTTLNIQMPFGEHVYVFSSDLNLGVELLGNREMHMVSL